MENKNKNKEISGKIKYHKNKPSAPEIIQSSKYAE